MADVESERIKQIQQIKCTWWCLHCYVHDGVYIVMYMMVFTLLCTWWCLHCYVHDGVYIVVQMMVFTLLCTWWCLHCCVHGGVYSVVYMMVCTWCCVHDFVYMMLCTWCCEHDDMYQRRFTSTTSWHLCPFIIYIYNYCTMNDSTFIKTKNLKTTIFYILKAVLL